MNGKSFAVISYTANDSVICEKLSFPDKYAAIVWMCKNQIGRRNISDEQRTVLIGEAYKAQKMTRGGDRGNQYTKPASAQNEHLPKANRTADKIAKDFAVGKETVKRAEQFLDGLNVAEEIVRIMQNGGVSTPPFSPTYLHRLE